MKASFWNLTFFIFFTFLSLITISTSYIVLPFQSFENSIGSEDFDYVDDIAVYWSNLPLYTEIYVGTPPQILESYLSSSEYLFGISKNIHDEDVSLKYIPGESETFIIPKENDTFIIQEEDDEYYNAKYYIAKDSFHLLTNEGELSLIYSYNNEIDANKYKKYDNINFLYQKDKKNNYIGVIGLLHNDDEKVSKYKLVNFFKELKKLSYIQSSVWSIKFDKNSLTDGNLVIGAYPHEYDKLNYFKEYYVECKNSGINYWILETNNFYLIKEDDDEYDNKRKTNSTIKTIKSINKINIEFTSYLMDGPMELFNELKDSYFYELFDDKKCDYKKVKYDELYDNKITVIFCNKEKFTLQDMKKFPSLNFYVPDLDQTFQISYKDVFQSTDEYIYFLILFATEIKDEITVGQKFLYNYMFTFNSDTNRIGFYRKDIKTSKKIEANMKKMVREISFGRVIIFGLIILGIVLIFRRFCLKKKKNVIDSITAREKIEKLNNYNVEQGYELRENN